MKKRSIVIFTLILTMCLVLTSCSVLDGFYYRGNDPSLTDKNDQDNVVDTENGSNDASDENSSGSNSNNENGENDTTADKNPSGGDDTNGNENPSVGDNTDNNGTDNGDNTPPSGNENDVENIIYPVIFIDELRGSDEIQVVREGECAIPPAAPTMDGYTFIGWYNGSVEWSFESAVTEELTLTAVWAVDISYELEGGENDEANPTRILSTDTLPIELLSPKKDGFSFTGWYTDGQFENAISSITSFEAHTLYAKWEKDVTEYTVKVVSAGGMPLSGLTLSVHDTDGYNAVGTPKQTDESGLATFYLPTLGDYSLEISGAPAGYEVKSGLTRADRYPLTDKETTVTLTSSPVKNASPKSLYLAGEVMHDFTLTDINGVEYTLSEILEEKQMVMLNFWFTGCPPCRDEFPHINASYNTYKDSVEILAINDYPTASESAENVASFVETYGLDMPVFKVGYGSAVSISRFPTEYYPTTVLIDRYGLICAVIVGSIPSEAVWNNIFNHFTSENYDQRIITDLSEFLQ